MEFSIDCFPHSPPLALSFPSCFATEHALASRNASSYILYLHGGLRGRRARATQTETVSDRECDLRGDAHNCIVARKPYDQSETNDSRNFDAQIGVPFNWQQRLRLYCTSKHADWLFGYMVVLRIGSGQRAGLFQYNGHRHRLSCLARLLASARRRRTDFLLSLAWVDDLGGRAYMGRRQAIGRGRKDHIVRKARIILPVHTRSHRSTTNLAAAVFAVVST
ncbi:hypothetical protein C8R45DRAFT_936105 [Mycena sanguinolenta]|nr:hypothetical protein C8R45DRAFT_936105 [Mycena sanguinolenta]